MGRSNIYKITLFLVILISSSNVCLSFSKSSRKIVVKFLSSTNVMTNRFTLGDIADVKDVANNEISRTIIGYSPEPGLSRVMLRRRVIRLLKRKLNLEIYPEGAEVISIHREGAKIDINSLSAKLKDWLAEKWNVHSRDFLKLTVKVHGNIVVPCGKQEFSFSSLLPGNNVDCLVTCNGFSKNFVLHFSVQLRTMIAVAIHRLNYGMKITPSDIIFKYVTLDSSPWNYVRRLDQLSLVVTRTVIRKGCKLSLKYLRKLPAVLRGSHVTIKYMDDSIAISAPGKSLQSGKLGQIIQVKNTHSGSVITARVVSSDTVVVDRVR